MKVISLRAHRSPACRAHPGADGPAGPEAGLLPTCKRSRAITRHDERRAGVDCHVGIDLNRRRGQHQAAEHSGLDRLAAPLITKITFGPNGKGPRRSNSADQRLVRIWDR